MLNNQMVHGSWIFPESSLLQLQQLPQSPRTKSWPKSGRRLVHTANRKALGPNLTETSWTCHDMSEFLKEKWGVEVARYSFSMFPDVSPKDVWSLVLVPSGNLTVGYSWKHHVFHRWINKWSMASNLRPVEIPVGTTLGSDPCAETKG